MYTHQLHQKSPPSENPARAGARKGGILSDGNANSISFSFSSYIQYKCFYCYCYLLQLLARVD